MAWLDVSIAKESLEKYEGNVDHMYLCPEGKVTVGVGHFIPSSIFATSLPFLYRGDQFGTNHITVKKDDPAAREHKMQEYRMIQGRPYGIKIAAESFKPCTYLYLKSGDIVDLFNKDFNTHLAEAKLLFKNFDACPQSAQLALIHLIYGVGRPKLSGWGRLRTAVASFNWAKAANEVSVIQWHNDKKENRNTLTKNLMNNAASSVDILQKSQKLDNKSSK
ncbi:MAG: hypothetical protein IPM94_13375 [bacterium]|nr:hypothetical protein [bacterium]